MKIKLIYYVHHFFNHKYIIFDHGDFYLLQTPFAFLVNIFKQIKTHFLYQKLKYIKLLLYFLYIVEFYDKLTNNNSLYFNFFEKLNFWKF